MTWNLSAEYATRYEAHFGSRVIRCFQHRPASIDELFRNSFARFPDHEAMVTPSGERWTYRKLYEAVNRAAAGFAARGLVAGDRIALLIGNDPAFVIALLAAARLNAITVPLNIREQCDDEGGIIANQ